jgi:predicted ATPase
LPFALPTAGVAEIFEAIADGDLLYPFDAKVIAGEGAERDRRRASRRSNGRRARKLLQEAGVSELPVSADGLLPSTKVDLNHVRAHFGRGEVGRDEGIVNSYVSRTVQTAVGAGSELASLMSELRYLGPLRSAPQRYYNRAAAAAGAGTSGEHIALHLFDSASEVDEVNEWLQALKVPYSLKVIPVRTTGGTAIIGDNVAIVLTDTRSGIDVSPADVGFGVSQVLPIVVQLLATQEGVICIEQPEIHIHPKLQTELAELIIHSVSETGRNNQLIIETHSEHLLMRLQRRMREQVLSPDDVAVLYVEQDAEGVAHVRRLHLDPQGYFIDPWPAGFFEDGLDDLFGGLG